MNPIGKSYFKMNFTYNSTRNAYIINILLVLG